MLVSQSCLTLCDPLVCSLPGSSLHGILQTRILQWVAIPFSRGSSQPSRSLLVIHFIYGSVYMSIPNSLPQSLHWKYKSFCVCVEGEFWIGLGNLFILSILHASQNETKLSLTSEVIYCKIYNLLSGFILR